jgi:hypothetical protein
MGTLDALRTWRDRHPEVDAGDWRVAQGRGWQRDLDESDVIADGRRMEDELARRDREDTRNAQYHMMRKAVPDNTNAARRVGNIKRDRFIETRPKGDRLVYVLLNELSKLDAEAARTGHTWYEANRNDLTTDQGSAWILRIRAKIAEAKDNPVLSKVDETPTPKANAWGTWRTLAAQLVEFGGRTGARFAIDTGAGAANDLAFWWIVPGRDQYEGRYFLRQVIGGQGDVRVRMSPEAMVAIARKIIEAGPKEAMLRYGREIGACGHCGRALTNRDSRRAGIGPVCAKGKGW